MKAQELHTQLTGYTVGHSTRSLDLAEIDGVRVTYLAQVEEESPRLVRESSSHRRDVP